MNHERAYEKYCSGICAVEDVNLREKNLAEGKDILAGENIIGTAFLIKTLPDGRGVFSTAKHVIQGSKIGDLELRFNQVNTTKNICPSGVMVIDNYWCHEEPRTDVAIILASPAGMRRVLYKNKAGELIEEIKDTSAILSKHTALPLAQDDDINPGSEVCIIGFPFGINYLLIEEILGPGHDINIVPVLKRGVVGQTIPADYREKKVFLYDIETAPGYSGSPIIATKDYAFRVIGIHTNGPKPEFKFKDIGYAACIKYLRNLYNQLKTEGKFESLG